MREERGVTKSFAKVCPCESCKKGRGESHKIAYGTIESYSATPYGGWAPQMASGEYDATWFMGVELETSVSEPVSEYQYPFTDEYDWPNLRDFHPDRRSVWTQEYQDAYDIVAERRQAHYNAWANKQVKHMTAEEAVSVAGPDSFWLAKHDSSVSGPEFASQPASLKRWYEIRPDLEAMFASLLHGGMRSHQGDTCGLHVNISLTAFDNDRHLARFALLINGNVGWSRRMSQRSLNSENSWAQIGGRRFTSLEDCQRWAEQVAEYGDGDAPRYSALNTPGMGRLEFRLPRGTLRIDRFYKNIEWVYAMVEYTRLYDELKAAPFMRWVMSQPGLTDLKGFLSEKYGMEEGVAFTPRLAPAGGSPLSSRVTGAVDDREQEYDGDDDYDPYWDEPDPEPIQWEPVSYQPTITISTPTVSDIRIPCECAACTEMRATVELAEARRRQEAVDSITDSLREQFANTIITADDLVSSVS